MPPYATYTPSGPCVPTLPASPNAPDTPRSPQCLLLPQLSTILVMCNTKHPPLLKN